jgi:hypothetical protein
LKHRFTDTEFYDDFKVKQLDWLIHLSYS